MSLLLFCRYYDILHAAIFLSRLAFFLFAEVDADASCRCLDFFFDFLFAFAVFFFRDSEAFMLLLNIFLFSYFLSFHIFFIFSLSSIYCDIAHVIYKVFSSDIFESCHCRVYDKRTSLLCLLSQRQTRSHDSRRHYILRQAADISCHASWLDISPFLAISCCP